MSAGEPGDVHVVVFDVNVYLDVASLVGAPFSRETFNAIAAAEQHAVVPHPTDPRVDSLRALAVCTSGKFVRRQLLEVWTSEHIDGLVLTKAAQHSLGPTPEQRGLGWTLDDAEQLLEDLVDHLVYTQSLGGTVGPISIPHGAPPLSHEDGCVYATAKMAGDENVIKYCVTRDVEFRQKAGEVDDGITVLLPYEWVNLVRESRRKLALLSMLPVAQK